MVAIDKTTGPGSGTARQNKADETTKAANLIISAEIAARDEKTARLRAARLASEAAARDAAPATAAPKGRRAAKAL